MSTVDTTFGPSLTILGGHISHTRSRQTSLHFDLLHNSEQSCGVGVCLSRSSGWRLLYISDTAFFMNLLSLSLTITPVNLRS